MARYALGFGLSPYSFLKQAFECPKISILDYDRFIKADFRELFSIHSGISNSEIDKHTIMQYASNLIDVSITQNQNLYRDILPKSKLKVTGQMYCPLCLSENPYFKISWRLTLNVGCPIHKIRLVNQCPHCGEPIRLELLNSYLKNVTYCFSCWRSLTINQTLEQVHDEVQDFTCKLYDAVEYGSVNLNENTQLFTTVWINGIWALINSLYSKRKKINYFQSMCDYFGIKTNLNLGSSKNYKRFGSESIEVRYLTIRLLSLALSEWPSTFISVGKKIGLTKSVVNPHNNELAYWLHQICKKDLHVFHYRVTDSEILSALNYMLKNNIEITRSALARLLGNDESMKLNAERKTILEKYKHTQNVLKEQNIFNSNHII